ncbi:hypothetical protein NEF87_003406 [Candidatus Lokiarchaeum ossiferum]|uniref:Mediator of RNA polymerase II transcription subunit 7 n=1 Tax=Candidatus Lokiarchaeum ossiferum TaxID=2951803 RepID=A0ABY6HUN3_9ARCH|nr:hypothetical protein NEF87_003406 [Candidatus Lokiarchaeum sp. B-35]
MCNENKNLNFEEKSNYFPTEYFTTEESSKPRFILDKKNKNNHPFNENLKFLGLNIENGNEKWMKKVFNPFEKETPKVSTELLRLMNKKLLSMINNEDRSISMNNFTDIDYQIRFLRIITNMVESMEKINLIIQKKATEDSSLSSFLEEQSSILEEISQYSDELNRMTNKLVKTVKKR